LLLQEPFGREQIASDLSGGLQPLRRRGNEAAEGHHGERGDWAKSASHRFASTAVSNPAA
jgi:hypothetical protein